MDSDSMDIKHQLPLDDIFFGFEAFHIFNNLLAVLGVNEISNIGDRPLNDFAKLVLLAGNQFKLDLALQIRDDPSAKKAL